MAEPLSDEEVQTKLKAVFDGAKWKKGQLHDYLVEKHGLSPSLLAEARKAGINWATILELLIKYGPMIVDIIRKLIDDSKAKKAVKAAKPAKT